MDIFEYQDEDADSSVYELSIAERLNLEIVNYQKFPMSRLAGEFCILAWWKSNENNFPILSKLARTVLAIPPSSSKPESDFSGAGYVKSQRRYNLSPDSLDKLLTTKLNLGK